MAAKNSRKTARRKTKGKRRGPGRPFPPGVSGNPAGRPKGSKNLVTEEMTELASGLLRDPAWREKFEKKWRRDRMPARLVEVIFAYAAGKPMQPVDVTTDGHSLLELLAGQDGEKE